MAVRLIVLGLLRELGRLIVEFEAATFNWRYNYGESKTA